MSKTENVVAFTASEAARELGVSPTHINRLLKQGELDETTVVAGSGRYITAESIAAYKQRREASQ